jgi:hypothetical protein
MGPDTPTRAQRKKSPDWKKTSGVGIIMTSRGSRARIFATVISGTDARKQCHAARCLVVRAAALGGGLLAEAQQGGLGVAGQMSALGAAAQGLQKGSGVRGGDVLEGASHSRSRDWRCTTDRPRRRCKERGSTMGSFFELTLLTAAEKTSRQASAEDLEASGVFESVLVRKRLPTHSRPLPRGRAADGDRVFPSRITGCQLARQASAADLEASGVFKSVLIRKRLPTPALCSSTLR